MSNNFKISGVVPPVVVPDTTDRKLDVASYERSLNRMIDAGVDGLFQKDDQDYYYYDSYYVDPDSYILYDSDRRYITDYEMSQLSLQELNYAKNEIYARRGRLFQSQELSNYFSQKNYRMTKSAFLKIVALSIAFCGLCYLISVPFAPWITRLLYPSLFGEANSLLLLANAAAMIAAAGTLAQTIVLRFCKTTKLLYVQIMYSVVYLGGGLAVLGTYGIMGFCWVAIAANLVRLIALILYGYTGIVQQKDR